MHDERGENFVVQYQVPIVCKDGITRKKIFYRCRPQSVKADTEAAKARKGAGVGSKSRRKEWGNKQSSAGQARYLLMALLAAVIAIPLLCGAGRQCNDSIVSIIRSYMTKT